MLLTNNDNDKEKKKPFSRILVNKLMIIYIQIMSCQRIEGNIEHKIHWTDNV